jgi:hypothetical protein
MDHVNWFWIGLSLTIPFVVGGVLALPFWWKGQAIFGNIFGTVIIFGAAFAFIMRERVELDTLLRECFDSGKDVCLLEPSAFTRFAIYAFIGLFQVILLFSLSLKVDERVRRRGYAPEWR